MRLTQVFVTKFLEIESFCGTNQIKHAISLISVRLGEIMTYIFAYGNPVVENIQKKLIIIFRIK